MLRFLFGIVLAIGLLAGEPSDAQSPQIEETITAQLEAFKKDDFAQAFTYASPGIQGIFGTAENFGRMVRGGYPMVWRPADVTYLELKENAGFLFQRVMITDEEGVLHLLEYQMIEDGGQWKINGVRLLANPPASA